MTPNNEHQVIPMTSDTAATKIADLHEQLFGYAKKSFEIAYEIGGILIEQKPLLGRKRWGAWAARLPFTHRQANNYMRLHRLQNEHRLANISSVAEFYSVLAQLNQDGNGDVSKLEKISNFDPNPHAMTIAEAGASVDRIHSLLADLADLEEHAVCIQRLRDIRDQQVFLPELEKDHKHGVGGFVLGKIPKVIGTAKIRRPFKRIGVLGSPYSPTTDPEPSPVNNIITGAHPRAILGIKRLSSTNHQHSR